jgi:hypothetical protein
MKKTGKMEISDGNIDLNRDRAYQGTGRVDFLRAMMAV